MKGYYEEIAKAAYLIGDDESSELTQTTLRGKASTIRGRDQLTATFPHWSGRIPERSAKPSAILIKPGFGILRSIKGPNYVQRQLGSS